MTRLIAVAIALVMPSFATAQDSITIKARDGFRFIRCGDLGGHASCEYIASGEGPMRCVAFDTSGEPLAAETAFARGASVTFRDLPAAEIAVVICS